MAKQDLYALLGVAADAGSDAIDAAYLRACATLNDSADAHSADSQNRLKFLRLAHETLMHKGRRTAYDASLTRSSAPAPVPAAPFKRGHAALIVLAGAVAAIAVTWFVQRGHGKVAPAASSAPAAVVAIDAAPAAAGAKPLTAEMLFERHAQSIVVIVGLDSESKPILQGSGVIVANQRVITNCHVAKSAAKVVVRFGATRYPATLLRVDADPEHDLCLLAVDSLHAQPLALGSVESLRVGQKVFALGAPNGLELTLSEGIVSSLRKQDDSHFIQTTASISPGSSGGGLLNDEGQLVGITTFQFGKGQNLNFAVPVDWVAKLLEKKESLAVLGPEALSDMLGRWRCESSKPKEKDKEKDKEKEKDPEKDQIVLQFGRDGTFTATRPDVPKSVIHGAHSIMGNHTLVLKSTESDPPEVYLQIMALSRTAMQFTSPFYDEAQTYQCAKTGV